MPRVAVTVPAPRKREHAARRARPPDRGTSRERRAIVGVELVGAAFMVALGSALHFVFDWSGGWRPLAIIAAVNESIWEHLKLAFWPGVLWAAIAPLPAGVARAEALAARGVTLPVTAALIVVIFTTYTTMLGRNLLPVDIGTFVLAILLGQLCAAWLLGRGAMQGRALRTAALLLLALQVVAYGLFTFQPPDHWLFIETSTQLRGIPTD